VRRRPLIAVGVAAVLAVSLLAVLRHGSHATAPRARVVVVAPDPAAAARATVAGATAPERQAARSALALVGPAAARMAVTFSDCPRSRSICRGLSVVRMLRVDPVGSRAAAGPLRAQFLGTLVARDAVGRLRARGERVAWRVTEYGQTGPSRGLAPVPLARMRRAAAVVASRAARAGWTIAPLQLFTTSGGAMVITVRFDDRTLLTNSDTAFERRLYGPRFRPPTAHTILLIEGPGDAFEGGGGHDVGAAYGGSVRDLGHADAVPTWLEHQPTRISVTIDRVRVPHTRRFTIRCGKTGTTDPATCTRLFRERAVLFSPVQSDDTCIGGAVDQSSVSGTVAGVVLSRDYSNCYGGVTAAWEALLGVTP
jgi:hypothetical protein